MELVWSMSATDDAESTPFDETALVAASRDGDRDAFGRLVRLHQHRVFRLAGRFFHQRADVEDAAQDTFLRAWRKLPSYSARAPFEHWLTRLCLNCCYDRLRARSSRERDAPLDDRPRAGATDDPAVVVDLERLLETLPPIERFVLLLLDGEGWTTAEIAERVGWSRTNVKVRAHRARRKLRRFVEAGMAPGGRP